MSLVTNVILTFEDETKLDEVNKYFTDLGYGKENCLVSCDDKKLAKGWYGGDKMLECEVCIGAFNHMIMEEFLEHLLKIKWEEFEHVQLFYKREEEPFRMVEIHTDYTIAQQDNSIGIIE